MIAILVALVLITPMTGVAQDPQEVDALRALARDGPDSVLTERVRQQPNNARSALRALLAEAAGGTSDSARAASLTAADRVAGAVAVAWRDSFLVRQVARFRSLSPTERQEKTAADSLERAGLAAFRSAGISAAMPILRESLRRFQVVADTAGIGSVNHNIGILFSHSHDYDSAETYLSRAKDLAERIGEYRLLGNALGNLGNVSLARDDFGRARDLYARAKPFRERVGDVRGLSQDQMNLGAMALSLGDRAGARRAFETALPAARSTHVEGAALVLNNLATLAAWDGDYAEAAAHLDEAVSTLRERGSQVHLAEALIDVAELAIRRGDYTTGVATLSEAGGILQRTGPTHNIGEIDVRLESARARALMGDLQGARTELARAEAVAIRQVGAGRTRWLPSLALAGGDLALRFNQFPEAERQYTRARHLARGTGERPVRFRAQLGLAALLFRTERYQRAEVALEQALETARGVHEAATVRLLIGQVALRLGDTANARRTVVRALDTLRALGAAPDEAEALGRLGDLEARGGRALAAESLYQRGLTRLRARPAPAVAWQLHAGLATSLRRRGAFPEAARELLAGIGEIERVSGSLQLEEHRSAFQADKWDVYVDLALVEHARGRTEAAFEASERLRGRQMLDLLARGRVAPRGVGTELASREQDLSRRMAELTRQQPPEVAKAAKAGGLRDRGTVGGVNASAGGALTRAQEEYGELVLEIREADPAYAALVRGEIASSRAVMAALTPDEALLEYLVGDSTTIVFVVTADTVAALELKLSHDALAAQVDFARSTLAAPTEGAARRTWRAPLRRLYQQLVGPVEASGLLAGKERLLIAPHAELHYLPFSALVRPGPPEQVLIERYLIEYVSSASVWLRLRGRPEHARGGDILALAPRAKALPGSRAEIAAIRQIYGDRAQTLVGTPATEQTFRALAPGREIVHLATYGVLNKHNPLFSYIEMGAGGGEDGRLEVHEVFGLTLNARLLVLSACQTGLAAGALADVPPGDDWVGLVQGFLYAGASNVMATLWPVADIATARLMERFYKELATGQSEAEALALAQRAALRDPPTAHPFFWAGFALVRGQ